MTKKRILIGIPCLSRGGTEMQTLLLVRALIESGYDVEVCCYFEFDGQVVSEFKAAGAEVDLLEWSRSLGKFAFIRDLAGIIRSKKPDVVHIQYMTPGLLSIVSARLAKVPVVLATIHYPGTPHGIVAHCLLKFSALLTNCFTCVSEAAEKSWFGESFKLESVKPGGIAEKRHLTISNAVDIECIDNVFVSELPIVSETSVQLAGKMIIGTIARLSREKGIDILLQAFAEVKKSIPHVHLLIVGYGNQLVDLQVLARQLEINESLTWTGRLIWEEAIGCLKLMDVIAVPSRFEGFGLTAVEAMACGKPVVASNVDGLAEVIKDKVTGILVPPANSLTLAAALIELLRDKEYRKKIGEAARSNVKENYSYPKFKEQCRILYEMFI